MFLLLAEIRERYHIPPGTIRSLISRGILVAHKSGGTLKVDDEDPKFVAFRRTYRPRSRRNAQPPSSHPQPHEHAIL
jgi:hypothetical protein